MQNKKVLVIVGLLFSLVALPAQAADFTSPECIAQNGGCTTSATTCIAPDYVVGGCINDKKEVIGVCCVSSRGNGSVCRGGANNEAGTCKDSNQCASGDVINAPGACTSGRVCCKLPNPNPTPGSVGKLNYTLLEQIPGPGSTSNLDLPGYLQALYKFSLWAIGIAALLMLSVGGFLYVTSAGNTARMGTAKEIISDSLIGLALALVAWLFLFIINPDFTKLKLPTVTPTTPTPTPPGTPPGVPTACPSPPDTSINCCPSGIPCQACSGCVAIPGNVPNKGCGLGTCFLNNSLLARIQNITNVSGLTGWRITESWPPTVKHQSACHSNGTCADLNNSGGPTDPATIKRYYDGFRSAGLTTLYESNNCTPYTAIGIPCGTYPTMTNLSSFHVY